MCFPQSSLSLQVIFFVCYSCPASEGRIGGVGVTRMETKRGVGFAREYTGDPWNSRRITKGDKYKVQLSPFSVQKSTFTFSLAPFLFCLRDNFVIWELISSTQYSFLRKAFTSCFLVALTMQSTVFSSKRITDSLLESQVLVTIVQQDIFIIAQIPHSRVITALSSFFF